LVVSRSPADPAGPYSDIAAYRIREPLIVLDWTAVRGM